MYKELSFSSITAPDPDDAVFSLGDQTCYVDRFKILEVLVPLSYETTNAANNTISWMEGGSTLKSVTIPIGQYTSVTWPAQMQTAMNSVSSNNYAVSYSSLTRQMTVTGNSSFFFLPGMSGSTAYKQLGLSRTQSTTPGTSVTLGVADFSATSPLILTSSVLRSPNCAMMGLNSVNALALIPVDAQPGSFLKYSNYGSWLECGQELSVVNFSFIDSSSLSRVSFLSNPFFVKLGILTDPDDGAV